MISLARSTTSFSASRDFASSNSCCKCMKALNSVTHMSRIGTNPPLIEAVDDVGRDPGIHRDLHHPGIGRVDEHGHRPPDGTADDEHLLQHVAAGVFQIDDDDLRIGCHQGGEQPLHLVDPDDIDISRLAKPVLDQVAADSAFIDDGNSGTAIGRLNHR